MGDLFGNAIKEWGLDFWIHLFVIIIVWTSPFFFSWWIILIGVAAYYFQLILIGDCILTRNQFKTKKRSVTFYWYYGRKIFPKLDMYTVKFFADYVFPYIILGLSIVWQLLLDFKPIIL